MHTKFIIARNGAKICTKIHEFTQRENLQNSNSGNLLVTTAQTSVARVQFLLIFSHWANK
jgi:hypothetical protein